MHESTSAPLIGETQIKILLLNQIKSNTIKFSSLVRGENNSTPGKTSQSRVENQQNQITRGMESRINPGPLWWTVNDILSLLEQVSFQTNRHEGSK